MNTLVTGGAGFIGSHTVDRLLAEGHRVRILDSLEEPVHPGNRRPDYVPEEAEFVEASILDRKALTAALEGVDAVFHFAAYQDYLTDFSRFFSVNTTGTALLYEIVVEQELPIKKIVVASSQAVYGEGTYRCSAHGELMPPQRSPERLELGEWEVRCPVCGGVVEAVWSQENTAHPHNPYAMSKRAQEEVALQLGRRYGIPTVALRYSIVQGPRQSFHNAYSGACRAFTVRLLNGKPAVIYEDGRQLRDYVYVGDVVAANMLVLNEPEAEYQAYNVGGGRKVSVLQLEELVREAVGHGQQPEIPGEYRFGDTRHVFSDISKLRRLGWSVTKTPKETVQTYVEWAASVSDIADTYGVARKRMKDMGVLRTAQR